MSFLPRALLIWFIFLSICAAFIGLVAFIPVHPRKGVDFLCCQDNNTYLAYRWLSNGVGRTYYVLEEAQRFVSGRQIQLCSKPRTGFWQLLFGRNGPEENGFLMSGICDINTFLAQQRSPAPKKWFQEAYEKGMWATTKKVLRKSYRGFKKAWAYFVDVPGAAFTAPSARPSPTDAILNCVYEYGLSNYLTILAIGSGLWIVSVVANKRLHVIFGRRRQTGKGQSEVPLPVLKTIVSRYIAHKLIKTGPNFHVFHLISRETHKAVFMKYLRRNGKKEARQSLVKAYRATRSLQHSNIVRFIDWIEGVSSCCLGLEFAYFGNLKEAISGVADDITVWNKVSIFQQILSAVTFLHKSGTAHLNIRPGSILVFDKWFCVKLSGFTHLIKVPPTKLCNRFDLHPIAIPNEALNGEPYDAFKADIWGLGSLFFYILVGDFFQNETNLPLRRIIFPVLADCESTHKKTIIVLLASLLACEPTSRPDLDEIQNKVEKLPQ